MSGLHASMLKQTAANVGLCLNKSHVNVCPITFDVGYEQKTTRDGMASESKDVF